MRVACLQFDVRADDFDANVVSMERGVERAARDGIELVVLPEMWPTSFTVDVGASVVERSADAVERARLASGRHGLVVCGSAYADVGTEKPANRLHVHDAGELRLTYDKVHLFSPTAEHLNFTAGADPPETVDTSAARLSGVVCYDLRFPELVRVPFRAGAELLVVSAQWPRTRAAHWRALVHGRAVEGQWFVVATNRTGKDRVGRRGLELEFAGDSLVVDPRGETLAEGRGEGGLVVADLDPKESRVMRRAVPVAKDERRDLYTRWS